MFLTWVSAGISQLSKAINSSLWYKMAVPNLHYLLFLVLVSQESDVKRAKVSAVFVALAHV